MQLPLSSTAVLAHFDFGSGLFNVQSANTTPSVPTVYDQVSGVGATQTTASAQPTYARSTQGVPSFYNSLAYARASSQCLTFDGLASTVATQGTWAAFIVGSTTSASTSVQDFFSFGKAAADGYIQMGVGAGSTWTVSCKNDATTAFAQTGGTADTNVHVFTVLKDAGALTLRVDGTTVITLSVSGNYTPNTMTLGGLRNNSGSTNFLGGNIYEFACYTGGSSASVASIESYFTYKYLKGLYRAV